MIRINKLTDYGFVLLTRFAFADSSRTARDLADETGLPLPTVSKLLKVFSRGGILAAHRGVHGGYTLTRPAESISATEIIEVIDGPIAITDCAGAQPNDNCSIEDNCPTKPYWIEISHKIRETLNEVSLAQLSAANCASNQPECHGSSCSSYSTTACTCGKHESIPLGVSVK